MPRTISNYVMQSEELTYALRTHEFGYRGEYPGGVIPVFAVVDPESDSAVAEHLNAAGRAFPSRREIMLRRPCARCSRYGATSICGPLPMSHFVFVTERGEPVVSKCGHVAWPYCICPDAIQP